MPGRFAKFLQVLFQANHRRAARLPLGVTRLIMFSFICDSFPSLWNLIGCCAVSPGFGGCHTHGRAQKCQRVASEMDTAVNPARAASRGREHNAK